MGLLGDATDGLRCRTVARNPASALEGPDAGLVGELNALNLRPYEFVGEVGVPAGPKPPREVDEGSMTADLGAVKDAGKVRVVAEVLRREVLRVGWFGFGWLRLDLREPRVPLLRGEEVEAERDEVVEVEDLVLSVVRTGR